MDPMFLPEIEAHPGTGPYAERIAAMDAVTVCALFNFYNRWIDATGVQDMPAAAYGMTGQRLKETGCHQNWPGEPSRSVVR